MEDKKILSIQEQSNDPSLPAKTTFQEDLTTAGQRRVNLIWEFTQASIAITVVISTMVAALYATLKMTGDVPAILAVAFGTVDANYVGQM